MSFLDPNIKTIIGTEPKRNWKDHIRGIKPSLDLKDQHETYLGKFQMKDKKSNVHTLYNSDGTSLLRLNQSGTFRIKIEIRDSENNFLAKTDSKLGLIRDLIWMKKLKD